MKTALRHLLILTAFKRLLTNSGYLDPNTGGMIFQALVAAFATISGMILVFSRRIKLWWAVQQRKRRERKLKQRKV